MREVIQTCEKIVGGKIPTIEKPRREGDPPRLVASAEKAIRELGWQPKFPKLEDIVAHSMVMAQTTPRWLSGLMIDDEFVRKLFSADKRTVARAISIVENQDDSSSELIEKIHHKLGRAYRVGITGPPGAGKSTIVSKLARTFSSKDKAVGIIAVDPTSPFTGGALLGDRIRMMELSSLDGIFISSMATRGSLGWT